ncbi:MAG: putative glycoside hydrolase [Paraglaciecola sp.]|uniref:putative glycoside hydrolase n=1 Tax=Paraglaciecola sp. TaxID=1920173 RepID=UPI00273FD928|nr:putative glycoside hydrolase [Paraglaciecola sp.]MDP5029103.1 putative glycoside hydrolase [Paraglaciecola sp.]MDP5129903.1 putative glycoside hydrolase [Paraglaciecola sp.]
MIHSTHSEKQNDWRTLAIRLLLVISATLSGVSYANTLNANYFYFFDGSPIGGWGLTLGDEGNWVLPITENPMDSANKQISISRAAYKTKDDALNLKWSRSKGKGQFAVYGSPVDLSQLADKAALTMEINIIKKPKSSVSIGMDCGYPCRGEVNIQKMLRDMKTKQWITFPIPINCFAAKGADLSKINSPIMIASEGQFEVQIANIRLELLPEGAPTCAS